MISQSSPVTNDLSSSLTSKAPFKAQRPLIRPFLRWNATGHLHEMTYKEMGVSLEMFFDGNVGRKHVMFQISTKNSQDNEATFGVSMAQLCILV